MEIVSKHQTQRKSVLHNNSNLINTQIAELHKSVAQLVSQNRKKLQQILKSRPHFLHQLYKVSESQNIHRAFGKQLLLRQLDRLLEQQNLLERQLSLIRLHHEQIQSKKQQLVATEIDNYKSLKTVWNISRSQKEGALQHVQSLNQIIGHIRHTVKHMIQAQSNCQSAAEEEYLRLYAANKTVDFACKKCQKLQQSKNQLRTEIEALNSKIENLEAKNSEQIQIIWEKEEQYRKISKKILELETQTKSKNFMLEEKLLMQDHQIKQLRKFKQDLQKNMFQNSQENYQIFIRCQVDLKNYQKTISLQLGQLLETLALRIGSYQLIHDQCQAIAPVRAQASALPSINVAEELVIPQLSLNITGKGNGKKTANTDRPRNEPKTERVRISLNQPTPQNFQQIEQLSKKYVRTNLLATKRNNRVPSSIIDDKYGATTVKTKDFSKNQQESQQ